VDCCSILAFVLSFVLYMLLVITYDGDGGMIAINAYCSEITFMVYIKSARRIAHLHVTNVIAWHPSSCRNHPANR
jgi:hypothetical protein